MKLAKSQIFIIVINSILFLIGFVLMFSFSVHAESSNNLPYYIDNDNFVNSDGYSLDDLIQFYNTRWSAYPLDFSSGVFIYEYTENNVVWTSVFCPESSSATYELTLSNSYNSFDITTDYATLELHGYSKIDFSNANYWGSNYYANPRLTRSSNVPGGIGVRLFSGGYTPLFANSLFYWFVDDTKVVFGYNDDITIPIVSGHATAPSNDSNNFINGLNGHPITKPTFPTINYYTYTTYTPPNIDTTNVESLLESIYDLIEYNLTYQTTNFVGQFNNLIDNISNLVDYIVLSFENGFNKIVKSIQDFATDIYNNFVSLFEPIFSYLDYITSPINSDVIVSGITDTNFYNGFEDTKDFFNDVDSIFDIEEPDHFIIEIHLEDLDFFDTGLLDFNLSTVYLNLGANILPFRNALRVFLWCMVSAGTVFYIQKNLPSMLKGDETGGNSSAK